MSGVSPAPSCNNQRDAPAPSLAVVDALLTRLSVAMGLAELVREEPSLSAQAQVDLESLVAELARAGDLVKQLQRGARPPGVPAEPP